jgi:putative acetyltransferase
MSSRSFTIRPIQPHDDEAVANLVRGVLSEFGCTGPGFALHDPEVDAMAAAYARPGHRFHVVELENGVVRGCGGYGPLLGARPEERIAELRKMYFEPALRGLGAGRALLETLLEGMRTDGYRRCYLETTSVMEAARALYRRCGFVEIPTPLGDTGHGACDRFFVRDL